MAEPFKNVLLVIRGRSEEQAAVERAVRVAKENGSKLTVFRVLRSLPPNIRMLGAALPQEGLEQMAEQAARENLEKAIAPAREQGCEIQIKIVWGRAFLEVIRQVLRRKHDLVILSASPKNSLRTKLLGSMTMQLMRNCPCAIWVVKPQRRTKPIRVLAAVAPEYESEESAALNRKILDAASCLAAKESGELHVLHAWNVFAESILKDRGGVPQVQIKHLGQQIYESQKKWFMELLAAYGVGRSQARAHLIRGNPEVVIPRFVRRHRVDVLVMGTVSRTGIPGFLIGNTAERILSHVDCSLLTLKPDGFVTPVKLK